MHFFREMVHSPALHDSFTQSSSTWQLQKPNEEPSRSRQAAWQKPLGRPGAFTHLPPRLHSASVAQGRAGQRVRRVFLCDGQRGHSRKH